MRFITGYGRGLVIVLLLSVMSGTACGLNEGEGGEAGPALSVSETGVLSYTSDERGNRIPDFSFCGYRASEEEIPELPVRLVIPNIDGDATDLIQSAIDRISALPEDENGFRGVILLRKGVYRLSGRLKITSSGIVIRGSGAGNDGTVLLAEGRDRMTLIRIFGIDDRKSLREYNVSDAYVPSGSGEIQISGRHSLKKGDRVFVHRPSTQEWIDALSAGSFGGETGWLGWKPGERDIVWDRTVEQVEGNTIRLDVPLTTALDPDYGGGKVIAYSWNGRIRNIGIENLKLASSYDTGNPKDESHCWMAITMENVEDAWLRQLEFSHFAGSAVAVYETARRVTVEDCISIDPVSEIGGQRRQTFFTMGQQCLFQRLYAENGRHDFAAGFCAAGPNAFVQCESSLPCSFSGAIDSWASGLLFDLVNIDGHTLSLKNRGQDGMGAGWCAASSMLWQCTAARIDCYSPPTADNWAYGCWSQFAGNGHWVEPNSLIRPRSLYYAQLAERLSRPASDFSGRLLPFRAVSSTSPTPELAAELTEEAYTPALFLKEWILAAGERNPLPISEEGAGVFSITDPKALSVSPDPSVQGSGNPQVMLREGRIVRDGKLLAGGRMNVPWWRGDPRPYEAEKARPAITRFVPGRYGQGYTDDIDEMTALLESYHVAAMEHNYGLWYDRRRDDHERIRRMDGEVWAPFYEQPFERTGTGRAWDGLSKYDLSRYNPWYWGRLKEFAGRAETRGILLMHHNYFQHNILEAGAHYADFPWRTANNINSTGFPEPPNYAGDKRIFMDAQFYDTLHPARRELHRKYIRKCLENFSGNSNVIQLLSAEYTGPLHFMQFWLDVIHEWEKENGKDALVALSATKDVQDAILEDPVRSGVVDIIDIRYWAYREDGSLYAPEGGKHMAPRQHARKIPPGKRSSGQVYRAVNEYRQAFPGKAVICSERASAGFGWAVMMAGGSLPQLPAGLPEGFLEDASTMHPATGGKSQPGLAGSPAEQTVLYSLASMCDHCLLNPGGEMILYTDRGQSLELDLAAFSSPAKISWIDPGTGEILGDAVDIQTGSVLQLEKPADRPLVLWLSID